MLLSQTKEQIVLPSLLIETKNSSEMQLKTDFYIWEATIWKNNIQLWGKASTSNIRQEDIPGICQLSYCLPLLHPKKYRQMQLTCDFHPLLGLLCLLRREMRHVTFINS